MHIALVGNPNCGKTTLFNALTGFNLYVGNWPGVTVEKKQGPVRGRPDAQVVDLPGVYSLSPYTAEEIVTRQYLLGEMDGTAGAPPEPRPDAVINVVDATNIERSLYLTTQLLELGLPVVVALNMMDVVEKQGDTYDLHQLTAAFGCEFIEISALKGRNLNTLIEHAVRLGEQRQGDVHVHQFSDVVELALHEIAMRLDGRVEEDLRRFYAVKLFERDAHANQYLGNIPEVEAIIARTEQQMDDDAESIIANQRYTYITRVIKRCYQRKNASHISLSDRIDRVVTHRVFALPIFALVMTLVYYLSVSTVGTLATDWVNDGLFGQGWHLFGIGSAQYAREVEQFDRDTLAADSFLLAAEQAGLDISDARQTLETLRGGEEADSQPLTDLADKAAGVIATAQVLDENGEITSTFTVTAYDFAAAAAAVSPAPEDCGIWVPGIPVLVANGLEKLGTAEWLNRLIVDGMIGGVGAVLGFVPQLLVLFLLLAFLEECGYMTRIAFILDRLFRRFGLSGKSFIPMLIGTGCSVPGIMASRTIESVNDQRITVMTTSFIPCGAKLPIIAMIAGALLGQAWWVAPLAYFIGIFAVMLSGLILKKFRTFAEGESPFVMELPAYHLPAASAVLRSMWDRGWAFIKKAGTIILLSSAAIWFLSNFGFADGGFGMVAMEHSLLAVVGRGIAWLFKPLGFGFWQAGVATLTGLVAKENVVSTFGVLYGYMEAGEAGSLAWQTLGQVFDGLSGMSFLVFNLLCIPCMAAVGAMHRELGGIKWTLVAVGYQTALAYAASLCVYQFGLLARGVFGLGTVAALAVLALLLYLIFRRGYQPAGKYGRIAIMNVGE